MDQNQIRAQQRRRNEIYAFELSLNEGHRGQNGHTHVSKGTDEIAVTKFTKGVDGGLNEVRSTLPRERR